MYQTASNMSAYQWVYLVDEQIPGAVATWGAGVAMRSLMKGAEATAVAGEMAEELMIVGKEVKPLFGACFIAGTMIATPSGPVEIQYLKAGDSVCTYNIESGQVEAAIIPNIFKRESKEFTKLYFASDSVTCTLVLRHSSAT